MARARNIKPSFFTNDELAEIPALGRLLFIALWTMADREGRLEDRPKRIKAEALPYDDCDCDALLAELEARRFIVRYEAAGSRFIQIITFSKHQNPHVKEAPSAIPPPGEFDTAPDKHGASTVQARCDAQPKPERAGLIPDSGFLIPDSCSLRSQRAPAPEEVESPTLAGKACAAMKRAGLQRVNPSDPRLLQLLSQGVTPTQLGDLAAELCVGRASPPNMAYVLATMAGRLSDAAAQPDPQRPAARARDRPRGTAYGDEIDRIAASIRGGSRATEPIEVEARHVG